MIMVHLILILPKYYIGFIMFIKGYFRLVNHDHLPCRIHQQITIPSTKGDSARSIHIAAGRSYPKNQLFSELLERSSWELEGDGWRCFFSVS
jgi:hypothetical protein